jgi:hypothetical protein
MEFAYNRGMSPSLMRFSVVAALVLGVVPGALTAQVVAGTVFDSTTKRRLAGVSVIVRDAKDSATIRGGITDSAGRFRMLLPKEEAVTVIVRRIGFQALQTPPRLVRADSIREFAFAMAPIPVLLDTMRAQGTKYLTGSFYKLIAGQEWFARHMRDGKGFFTSGREIQLSGMDPCDYLGRLPGFQISSVLPPGGSGIGCHEGHNDPSRYVVPKNGGCVQPMIDKTSRLVGVSKDHFLVVWPGQSSIRWFPIDAIRGIEVFARYEDRPRDFSNTVTTVRAASRPPVTGLSRSQRQRNTTLDAAPLRCALLLVWSTNYWGDP